MNRVPKPESPESPDERELSAWMRAAQRGDAEAYRALLGRVKSLLDSYVRNSLQRRASWAIGSADDIVQETLMGLHTKRHTYDPKQRFLPWFYAIAHYKVIDALRAGARLRRHVELDEELEETAAAPQGAEELAGVDAKRLLQELPEKQRLVLELVKLQGLSIQEASQRTGYSVSDIKVTVHRAIRALREKTGPEGGTDE